MIGGGVLKRKCPICNKPLPEKSYFLLIMSFSIMNTRYQDYTNHES